MEDDRAHVDLGIAADIQERQEEAASQRQPKKRFVGRRQVAEAASRKGVSPSVENSGAVTGTLTPLGPYI
jgi:2-(3-amino-3-carboxypropyl)histidine synthase